MSFSEASLLHIPEIPMKNIFEYLEFPSILILRKVCRDLRNFIDVTKPSSHLTEIHVDVNSESIKFKLYFPRSSPICIRYVKKGDGCLVKCEKGEHVKETILENEDFATVFCKDFDIVLRHQKTVLYEFQISSKDLKVKEKVLESVNQSLKSMNYLLQVKTLYIGVNNHNKIMTILPYIDSRSLREIFISTPLKLYNMLNIDEIAQLEQWKQADRLSIRGFQLTVESQNLKHFSRVFLDFRAVSTEELILLKEIFISSSNLNTMTIHNDACSRDVMKQKLIGSFGQDHLRNWFCSIPSTNQFLRITKNWPFILFERIKQTDVPLNARISN